MLCLTPENAKAYLIAQGLLRSDEAVSIEPLGWGVSNVVLKVTTPRTRFVVKQSLPKLRVRDDWFSTLDRIFIERACLEVLSDILEDGAVPKVLFEDRDNYLFAMACVPEDAALWKEQLLGGQVDLSTARRVGDLLARIHRATFDQAEIRERFGDPTNFLQLRVDPYHRTICARHPDVGGAVEAEVARMLDTRLTLVHGDYSPKNLFVRGDRIVLLDCEVAHWGDPAFDAAFCLNHLLLKAIYNHPLKSEGEKGRRGEGEKGQGGIQHRASSIEHPTSSDAYFDAARSFWEGYASSFSPPLSPPSTGGMKRGGDLERNTVREVGCLMLARVDGKSPVEYLTDEGKRALARRVSKEVLLGSYERLEQVITLIMNYEL